MSNLRTLLSKCKTNVLAVVNGISCYFNDMKYFINNSKVGNRNQSQDSWRASLAALYHVIEKGLCMPNRRLRFGRERLMMLIEKCDGYYKHFGVDSQLAYAIAIIKEYDELHKSEKYELDSQLQSKIDMLLRSFPNIQAAKQVSYTREQYFSKTAASFDEFSKSRHSMRHFSGNIPLETIEKAIDLAKNAPSACNKQPVRVYIVSDTMNVKQVLDMQQGNRGFGQTIDKVLIVTTQFSGCTRYSERYMPFMDAGIFTMNLLYSLHYYHVGAIPLVWLNSKKRDMELRKLVGISSDEIPAIIVGTGDVSNDIICAISPRLETDIILKNNTLINQ